MLFFCSFSYRGKIIIKGVSNIVGIGYSFAIIKGEYSWYVGCYSFQRNQGFNSFLFVLNIIPISFKIFIIISLFTFFISQLELMTQLEQVNICQDNYLTFYSFDICFDVSNSGRQDSTRSNSENFSYFTHSVRSNLRKPSITLIVR